MPEPVVTPPLVTETKVAGREASPKDVASTERLNRYWTEGAGAAKIRWGVPGDFKRCDRLMAKYIADPEQRKGHCANLHKRATGGWPGHAPGVESAAAAAKKATEHKAAVSVAERAGKTLAEILDLSTLIEEDADLMGVDADPVEIAEADLPEIESEMPSPFDEGITLLFCADGSLVSRDADGRLLQIVEPVAQEEIDALPEVAEPDHVDVDLNAVEDEAPDGEGVEVTPDDETPPEGTEPEDEQVADDSYPAGDEGDLDADYDPQADLDPEDLSGPGTKGVGRMACGKTASACDHTMGDDSYPIHNKTELGKAITAYPRGAGKGGKTKRSIRAHIRSAAERLDLTDQIPEQWSGEEKGLEVKAAFPYMEGSAEATSAVIERAVRDALIPETEPGQPNNVWVSVFGTFPDRVYVTVNDYSGGKEDAQSYEIAYVIDDDEVTLGVPQPVEKVVSVEPTDDDTEAAKMPLNGVGLAVKTLQAALDGKVRLGPVQVKALQTAEVALARTLAEVGVTPEVTSEEPSAETGPGTKGVEAGETKALGDGEAFISEAEILAARSTYADLV